MGKTITRAIGAGFALALAGAAFDPAVANAEENGEISVPRVVDIQEGEPSDNNQAEISIEANLNDEDEFEESLTITLTNTANNRSDYPDSWVDRHCYYYLNSAGDIPDDLVAQLDAGDMVDNLLNDGGWANNHGDDTITQDFNTSDLEDGTYTVASVCEEGDIGHGGGTQPTELSGTQDFILSTPAEGSLGDLGLGSLEGGSLGGSLDTDSLGGGSAGDTGSAAAVGSLVLGGGLAAGIHAHNIGLI